MYVEQWHYQIGAIGRGELIGIDDILHGCSNIEVSKRHTYGIEDKSVCQPHTLKSIE